MTKNEGVQQNFREVPWDMARRMKIVFRIDCHWANVWTGVVLQADAYIWGALCYAIPGQKGGVLREHLTFALVAIELSKLGHFLGCGNPTCHFLTFCEENGRFSFGDA